MRKIRDRVAAFCLLAGLSTALVGCELVPDPEFAALERTLELRILGAKRGGSDEQVAFSFMLKNRGNTNANACLGPSRSVFYRVGSWGGGSSTFVDHPGCAREFAIAPAAILSWDETLETPRLPGGRAEVEVGVQIVNPRRCGNWGNCAAFELRATTFIIP